ncbi:MAG: hypothetical protein IPK15_09585 [Verrucomicrobia bacterium]|nr:hypothetical protein [Verrucomicrobiota bacterium]
MTALRRRAPELKPPVDDEHANQNRVLAKLIDPLSSRWSARGRCARDTLRPVLIRAARSERGDPMAVTDENGEFFLDYMNGLDAITVDITARSVAAGSVRRGLDVGKAHLIRMTEGVLW